MEKELKVKEIISRITRLEVEEIETTSLLSKDLGMDFIDITETVMDIEKEFEDASFPDNCFDDLKTVQNLIDRI